VVAENLRENNHYSVFCGVGMESYSVVVSVLAVTAAAEGEDGRTEIR